MDEESEELEELEDDSFECKGAVYRAHVNAFINSKGQYVYQERMVPMKRMSCSGCADCGFIEELLEESMGMEDFPIIKDIVDNALYSLEIINHKSQYSYDGEIEDEFELEFVRLNEETS